MAVEQDRREATGTDADLFWAIMDAYGFEPGQPWRVPRRSDGWHPTLADGEPDALEIGLYNPAGDGAAERAWYR